jgi:NADH-quinone oxidoreductase subunit A
VPTSANEIYFPILVQVVLAMAIAAGMLSASAVLGKRVKNAVKDSPYECGITPVGTARERFSVKFYLVAMMFILFDIETVFLYPWAVVFRELKMFALVEMLVFVMLILAGFFYIWKKGALAWSYEEQPAPMTPAEGDELWSSYGGGGQPKETVGTSERPA